MLSISIVTTIMISSGQMASHLPVGIEYEHRIMADDDFDRTYWLPEVMVTAEPIKAAMPDIPRIADPGYGADNTYWLPEVLVTAKPIRESKPSAASGTPLRAPVNAVSAVIGGMLVLFSTLLGLELFARPKPPPCPSCTTPNRVRPLKNGRRRPNRNRPYPAGQ